MRSLIALLLVVSFSATALEIVAGESMQPSSDPFCGS